MPLQQLAEGFPYVFEIPTLDCGQDPRWQLHKPAGEKLQDSLALTLAAAYIEGNG